MKIHLCTKEYLCIHTSWSNGWTTVKSKTGAVTLEIVAERRRPSSMIAKMKRRGLCSSLPVRKNKKTAIVRFLNLVVNGALCWFVIWSWIFYIKYDCQDKKPWLVFQFACKKMKKDKNCFFNIIRKICPIAFVIRPSLHPLNSTSSFLYYAWWPGWVFEFAYQEMNMDSVRQLFSHGNCPKHQNCTSR